MHKKRHEVLNKLLHLPGTPPEEVLGESRSVAFIECDEKIPCNPCETSCPSGAIHIGEDITALPSFDYSKCTGCGLCIAKCPGLAVFVVNGSYSDETSLVSIPYEFIPLPEEGDEVIGIDREGEDLCTCTVLSVKTNKAYDHTPIVSLIVPKEYRLHVRHIKLKL